MKEEWNINYTLGKQMFKSCTASKAMPFEDQMTKFYSSSHYD